jgi:protein Mpv17
MGVSPPSHQKKMNPKQILMNRYLGNNASSDEEESCSAVELKSLARSNSNNNSGNGVAWLSHEGSAVSHHKLDGAELTLRLSGGADDDVVAREEQTSSLQNKKKSSNNLALGGFAKWYMHQMETHELRTKCVSAGLLGLVGDVCAQEVGHYYLATPSRQSDQIVLPAALGLVGFLNRLDKQRMLAMFCDGALTTGPLLHFVYAFYESVLPIPEVEGISFKSDLEKKKATRRRLVTALIHVLFDNFVMAVLYVFLMMTITAILEGKALDIPKEMRHDFYPAIKASWKASLMGLAPMQLISFHFLPVELRVLAVNVQDVVWVTVMSFVTHRNRH